MSTIDFKTKRLDKNDARKRIVRIVKTTPNKVTFIEHATMELRNDGYGLMDAWSVLNSPAASISKDGEFENGAYRYRLETNQICLVFQFWPCGTGIVVITGWAKKGVRR